MNVYEGKLITMYMYLCAEKLTSLSLKIQVFFSFLVLLFLSYKENEHVP